MIRIAKVQKSESLSGQSHMYTMFTLHIVIDVCVFVEEIENTVVKEIHAFFFEHGFVGSL